jgi:hypothetical protein
VFELLLGVTIFGICVNNFSLSMSLDIAFFLISELFSYSETFHVIIRISQVSFFRTIKYSMYISKECFKCVC